MAGTARVEDHPGHGEALQHHASGRRPHHHALEGQLRLGQGGLGRLQLRPREGHGRPRGIQTQPVLEPQLQVAPGPLVAGPGLVDLALRPQHLGLESGQAPLGLQHRGLRDLDLTQPRRAARLEVPLHDELLLGQLEARPPLDDGRALLGRDGLVLLELRGRDSRRLGDLEARLEALLGDAELDLARGQGRSGLVTGGASTRHGQAGVLVHEQRHRLSRLDAVRLLDQDLTHHSRGQGRRVQRERVRLDPARRLHQRTTGGDRRGAGVHPLGPHDPHLHGRTQLVEQRAAEDDREGPQDQ